MGRVLAGWHLAMAIGGALLMVLGARPFRSGPWLHTNGFVWLSVTLAAVSLGVLGGLVEGWMLKRHLPLFAAVIVAAVSIPMLMVTILFIGRMAHTEAYALTPDTVAVPLVGWLAFHAIVLAVARRMARVRPSPVGAR